jgi:hypothetical protein
MRWPVECATGLAVLAAACPALPAVDAGEPIALTWVGPPGCPSEREVRAEIERVLGGPPDPAIQPHLRAEARVSGGRGGDFHVHLITDLGGVIGERDLHGRTCAAVANAAALIVALTFDPAALARRTNPAPAPPPPVPISPSSPAAPAAPVAEPIPPPLPAPLPPPPPSTVAERAPSRRPGFAVGILGAASIGALPGVGAGVGGLVGVRAGRFRADVSASYWPDKTAMLATEATVGGRFRLVAGDASACYAVLTAPVEIAPCLGLEVGSMTGAGVEVRSSGSGSALWVAPLAAAMAALPVGQRFAARFDLGVLVPVERPPFVLSGERTVYTAGPIAGRATLGIEVRF